MKERAFLVLVIIIVALVGLKACASTFESLGDRMITEQYEYMREPSAPVDAFTAYRASLMAPERVGPGFLFYGLLLVLIAVVLSGCWFVFANGFETVAKQTKSLRKVFEPAKQLPKLPAVQRVPQLTANSWLEDE